MLIVGKERYTDMTPTEFEHFSLNFLKEQTDMLEDGKFEHNVMMKTYDGTYQIDGKIEFSYKGLKFICLVECKRYRGPIKRENVAALYAKVQSIGAQKGIFITTSYFQRGALLYAKEHGIALITITDEGITYYLRSDNMQSIHKPCNGTMFVPVLSEAITEESHFLHYIYEKSNETVRDFMRGL